jgi:hypothetical protein
MGRPGHGGCAPHFWQCANCAYQASLTAGTIFQDTRTPLEVCFRALCRMTSQKNGFSALGLQRVLGLGSYQTAWCWLHRLRRAMLMPGRSCRHMNRRASFESIGISRTLARCGHISCSQVPPVARRPSDTDWPSKVVWKRLNVGSTAVEVNRCLTRKGVRRHAFGSACQPYTRRGKGLAPRCQPPWDNACLRTQLYCQCSLSPGRRRLPPQAPDVVRRLPVGHRPRDRVCHLP